MFSDIWDKSCIPWDAWISVNVVAIGSDVYITPCRRSEEEVVLVTQRHSQGQHQCLQASFCVMQDYVPHRLWPDLKQLVYRIKKT